MGRISSVNWIFVRDATWWSYIQSLDTLRQSQRIEVCSVTSALLLVCQGLVLVRSSYSCIVLYCIVLYLSIYIAPLAVHTNQRRSQCERHREKKEVFRQRKEALGPPVNKQERVKGGSWFQSAGPMKAKARVLAIAVLARGTKRS